MSHLILPYLFFSFPFSHSYHSFVEEDNHRVAGMESHNHLVVVEGEEGGIHLVLDYRNHVEVVVVGTRLDCIHRIVVDYKPYLIKRRKKSVFNSQGKAKIYSGKKRVF